MCRGCLIDQAQKDGWKDECSRSWLKSLEKYAVSLKARSIIYLCFLDNCSGHNGGLEVDECLKEMHTELRKLPLNTIDLLQPADSFVISKVKEAWRREWDKYKAGEIACGEWMGSGKGCSGKLKNPGKPFFLELGAKAVKYVNNRRDNNGLSYATKAMIRTVMVLNLDGLWDERKLFTDLQGIIAKHRNHFDGQPIE